LSFGNADAAKALPFDLGHCSGFVTKLHDREANCAAYLWIFRQSTSGAVKTRAGLGFEPFGISPFWRQRVACWKNALLTEDAQAVESAYLGALALFDPVLRTSEPSESLSQAGPAGKGANAGVASRDRMVKP
jgi:hypothetical protein